MIGRSLGLLATGLAYGSIGNDAGDLMGDSEAARDMMVAAGGDLVDGFFAMAMTMLALLTAGFAISSALRPRGRTPASRRSCSRPGRRVPGGSRRCWCWPG